MTLLPRDQIVLYKSPLILFLLLITVQLIPWSYHTSGVLQQTYLWTDYVFGYGAFLPEYSNWEINKENLFYIKQFQSFLNTPEAYVEYASGFEFQRALYALLTRGLWFLGPLYSGITLNALAWAAACFATIYSAASFSTEKSTQLIAALLVAAGPGFLYSMGEISPHVIGYATGFWVLGLIVYYRLWLPESTWQQHFYVYAIVGLLQLCYNSPWLSLPTLFGTTLIWLYQTKRASLKDFFSLCFCLFIAIAPSLIFMISSSFIAKSPGVISFVYSMIHAGNIGELITQYLYIASDSFISYGPIIVIFSCVGFFLAHKNRLTFLLFLTFFGASQFALTSLFLLPVSGRGYVTFGVVAPFIMLTLYALSQILKTFKHGKIITLSALVFYITYNNAPLMGFSLVGKGFAWGYSTALNSSQYQTYKVAHFD